MTTNVATGLDQCRGSDPVVRDELRAASRTSARAAKPWANTFTGPTLFRGQQNDGLLANSPSPWGAGADMSAAPDDCGTNGAWRMIALLREAERELAFVGRIASAPSAEARLSKARSADPSVGTRASRRADFTVVEWTNGSTELVFARETCARRGEGAV